MSRRRFVPMRRRPVPILRMMMPLRRCLLQRILHQLPAILVPKDLPVRHAMALADRPA
jgi:hypothetical protein